MIPAHIPLVEKVLIPAVYTLLGVSILEIIDYTIRFTAGALGIMLTVYLIQRARAATEADRLTIQIKKLELERLEGRKGEPENSEAQ
jgi:hypothetical protein